MSASPEPAGLFIRVAATAVDVAFVLLVTLGVVRSGRVGSTYIPYELTFLLVWLGYAVAANAWRQRTLGKAIVQRRRWMLALVTLGLVAMLAPPLAQRMRLYLRATRMIPSTTASPARPAASPPRNVQTVSLTEHPALVRWLDEHARPPEEFAVAIAARHQLTIFGEYHHVGDNLRFLARLIPDLYHRAGVTRIAMEALVWDDNAALERLVTAEHFNRGQALDLARHEGWKSWGGREYWDVLEAVWRVNRGLAADQPRLRVIGLDREWDLPSWSLVGMGDDARPGPWWERLRLVRVLADLPLMAKRDELMAWRLEQEVFAKSQRAVAWVGAAHAYTDFAMPTVSGDPSSARRYRLGAILRQRYGEQVTHLRLHDATYEGPELTALIETVQAGRGHAPAGFDVGGSPFADLRDPGGFEYRRDPGARFADFATGYLYLKSLRGQRHCTWEEGFITRAMFLRDKPYYEAQTGRRLRDAAEANETFRQQWER